MKGQRLPGSKKSGLKEAASGERPAKLIKCGSSLPCSLAENPPEPFRRDLDISKGPCELNEDPRAETLQMSVRWGPLNAVWVLSKCSINPVYLILTIFRCQH